MLLVCQVADPSLTSNLKGLLLNGVVWATIMLNCRFLDGLQPPMREKTLTLEAPVASRHRGTPVFASPALLFQENLDFLMA